MAKFSHAEVYDTFIGSGALSYPWWGGVSAECGIDDNGDAHEGWTMEVVCGAPDDEKDLRVVTFSAPVIFVALSACARGDLESVSQELSDECALFILRPECTDFDAASADSVLQVAAFGEVIFG
jgi:hypothetical protein